MILLRNLMTALVLMVGSISFAQDLMVENGDLADYMTPAQLMQEVGVYEPFTLWQASFQNPRLVIVIDRAERGFSQTAQTIELFLDGQSIASFKTSTGKEKRVTTPKGETYFATTPVGEYRIYYRNRHHKSNKWSGAEMNFAQFFNGGIAIHATTESHFNELGRRDSGGCARLLPRDAEMLWDLVGNIGSKETKVIVFDGSEQKHPIANSWNDVMYDDGGLPMSTPKPMPIATPRPVAKATPQPMPKATPKPTPTATPKPTPTPVPQYPPQWLPSPNPTPPPLPPQGVRDTYPYCRSGFWCPYN